VCDYEALVLGLEAARKLKIKHLIVYGDVDVTHYFGHPDDDSTSMCLGSQKDLLHEEND
jgi:hypothetical protein